MVVLLAADTAVVGLVAVLQVVATLDTLFPLISPRGSRAASIFCKRACSCFEAASETWAADKLWTLERMLPTVWTTGKMLPTVFEGVFDGVDRVTDAVEGVLNEAAVNKESRDDVCDEDCEFNVGASSLSGKMSSILLMFFLWTVKDESRPPCWSLLIIRTVTIERRIGCQIWREEVNVRDHLHDKLVAPR